MQSRCIRFKFKRIPFELALPRIRDICRRENIDIGEEAVKAAFNMCEGDMRRVVNMLQSLSLSLTLDRRELTARDVYEITGNPSPERMKSILEILLTKNPAEALASKHLLKQPLANSKPPRALHWKRSFGRCTPSCWTSRRPIIRKLSWCRGWVMLNIACPRAATNDCSWRR